MTDTKAMTPGQQQQQQQEGSLARREQNATAQVEPEGGFVTNINSGR